MENRDLTVLFFSEVDWGYLRQRHQIFSEKYAKKNIQVIYIGRIGLRYPRITDFKLNSSKISNLEKTLPENIQLFPKGLLPPINVFFNFINKILFLPKLIRKIRSEHVVIHYYQPTELIRDCYEVLKKNPNIKITLLYDCVQDYRFHPSKSKKLLQIENQLISKCDLVIADSKINFDRINSDNKILVPPGVDVDHFSVEQSKPQAGINILYYGNIRGDLDLNLLKKIALSKQFRLTLIGLLNISKDELHENIIVKPAVSYEELPKIIQDYDILLLPYKTNNSFTKAIIPAKFFECLATNLPIMSSDMPSLQAYKHLLTIVNHETNFNEININPISYQEKIKRKEILTSSSWDNRFSSFFSKIEI